MKIIIILIQAIMDGNTVQYQTFLNDQGSTDSAATYLKFLSNETWSYE